MNATITRTGDFVGKVEICRISTLDKDHHVAFSSLLLSSSNPDEVRRSVSTILQRKELLALRKVVDAALCGEEA